MINLTDLERRVEALERELGSTRQRIRSYRLLCAALALAITGGLITAAERTPVSDVLQARRIEVLDAQGNLVFAASSNEHGGQIDLWNQAGANLLRASCNAQGGDLAVWNKAGLSNAGMFATESGGELALWTAEGKRSLRAWAATDGGRIDLHNHEDQPVWSAASTAIGGSARITNATGQAIFTVDADNAGMGRIRLANADGQTIVEGAANALGGQLNLFNSAGVTVLSTSATETGSGRFVLANRNGAAVVTATTEKNEDGGRLEIANDTGREVFAVNAVRDSGVSLTMRGPTGQRMCVIGTRAQGGLVNVMNSKGNPVFIAGSASDGEGGAVSIRNGRGVQVFSAGIGEGENGIITVWDADGRWPRSLRPSQIP